MCDVHHRLQIIYFMYSTCEVLSFGIDVFMYVLYLLHANNEENKSAMRSWI
jgi:hypothetical protein